MIYDRTAILALIESGRIAIDPLDTSLLKEASYTLTASRTITLKPQTFVNIETREHVQLSQGIAMILSLRGSVAQRGICGLLGSHFAEPDTDNPQTIELVNLSGEMQELREGEPLVKALFVAVGSGNPQQAI